MSIETITTAVVPTGTWTVDAAHSSVGFAVKHMGIATVRGEFARVRGHARDRRRPRERHRPRHDQGRLGRHRTRSSATRTCARPTSSTPRQFPEITFESTRIEALDDETFRITGDLTMHGVTNEIVLHAEVQGTDIDPWGNERVGLEVTGQLYARRLRHEVQPGARQRQHARRRQGQARPRRLGREGVAMRPVDGIHHITLITGDAPRQRRLLRPRARAAAGEEDGQPGRPDRLPPLLRRRAGDAGRRHHVLRVPGRAARPGRRGDGLRDRPPRRLRGCARLLGAAARRRGRRDRPGGRPRCASPTPRACATSSASSRRPTRR